MRNSDVEAKLKHAVGSLTPDVLDGILSKCDGQQENVYVIQPQKAKKRWIQTVGALAASFALICGGLLAVNRMNYNRIDAWVMLDVNPSIELRLNRANRVVGVEPRNEDAVVILDNMDLMDTPVDVAVNALVGSMLKYGYVHESENSVLISVGSADGEKSVVLQNNLAQSVSQQLNMVNGAVISQNLTSDDALRILADEHQISYGKASLVQKILDENSHLLFADLADLSVNELNLLVSAKSIKAEGMEAQGNASDTAYIGEDKAIQTALESAGIRESDAERLRVELDYDNGAMIYEVEFYYGGAEYEYEINAAEGAVIGYDRERGNANDNRETGNGVPSVQNEDDFIGEGRAVEIAENHSGVTAYTGLKVELDKDDGVYIYEVEFKVGSMEYEYEINATTEEILSWEADD